ncbi:helix-turn-helix domain-containing protein [Pseudarthrobacter sp. J1738]|uniref:helix-turn-helix domain-containing protein n=1 Tax=unclassified Pseudarthrobacter TaxID=2647000 RepID=UPI003D28350F
MATEPNTIGYWVDRLNLKLIKAAEMGYADLGVKDNQTFVLYVLRDTALSNDELETALEPFWRDNEENWEIATGQLIEAGMISSSDGLLRLTDKGREVDAKVTAHVDRLRDATAAAISAEERAQTIDCMRRLSRAIEEFIEEEEGE